MVLRLITRLISPLRCSVTYTGGTNRAQLLLYVTYQLHIYLTIGLYGYRHLVTVIGRHLSTSRLNKVAYISNCRAFVIELDMHSFVHVTVHVWQRRTDIDVHHG